MGERTAVRTGSAFRLPKKRKYIRKKQRQYLPLHAVIEGRGDAHISK